MDHPKALQLAISITPLNSSQAISFSSFKQGGSTKVGNDYICKVTAEGRINVPKALLKQVSAIGGTFDISIDGEIIYKKPTVEGRVRISRRNLGDGDSFRISIDGNKIIIETE